MFEEYKINRKKHRIQGAMILVVIEAIIILFLLRWLKNNYNKWTWNPSTKEWSIYEMLTSENKIKPTNEKTHSIVNIDEKINLTWDNKDYKWLFGNIDIKSSNTVQEGWKLTYETTDSLNIYLDKIYSYFLLKEQLIVWILDRWILNYIINTPNINIETTVNDLQFLIPDLKLDKSVANEEEDRIVKTIKESNKDWIIQTLNDLEKDYNETINSVNSKNIKNYFSFTETQAFEYIRNQLVLDESNKYSDIIKSASKKFDIDEDIIKSVIFTEQLRWLTTYRGIFKSLVAWNKYLMIMSQFSYWLWWIKEKSAKEIEDRYKINNENIYNEIFAYPDNQNISYQRISRLTSVNDYYYQIMYVAWVLAMYRDQRSKEWYNISDKIWILMTLYNIWYKQPNDQPEIWWANIKINWESLSFGRLSTSIFYIIKSYKYN